MTERCGTNERDGLGQISADQRPLVHRWVEQQQTNDHQRTRTNGGEANYQSADNTERNGGSSTRRHSFENLERLLFPAVEVHGGNLLGRTTGRSLRAGCRPASRQHRYNGKQERTTDRSLENRCDIVRGAKLLNNGGPNKCGRN